MRVGPDLSCFVSAEELIWQFLHLASSFQTLAEDLAKSAASGRASVLSPHRERHVQKIACLER